MRVIEFRFANALCVLVSILGIVDNNVGDSVTVCIEASMPNKLQHIALISIKQDGK